MDDTSYIALSRLVAQQRAIDVTANNIANANTTGYRTERVLFSDWLSKQTGAATPSGGEDLAYTQDRATWREQAHGAFTHTGNPLDLAIGGNGFFTVQTPRGPRLTRAGDFGLLPDGTVADPAGDALLDTTGKPVQVAPSDTGLTVAADGTLSSSNGQITKIGVVTVADPNQLKAEGGSLFAASSPTTPEAAPQLVQGAREESNVQPVLELTRMMTEEREFQFTTQFVQAESDREQNAIDKITQTNG